MLCESSKFLSFLVFQPFNKMVVRRGALRYWPGAGLEPIKNECPFLGYSAECCVRDPLPGLQGPNISSINTNAICPPVDGRFDPLSVFFDDVWQKPWNRSPPPSCINDAGNPCCVDLVNAAPLQVPGDASPISPLVSANGAAVNQEGDQSEVEVKLLTENLLPVQGDPLPSTWNQISVQGDSFLNQNQESVTEGSSSTGSQQQAQGYLSSTGGQLPDQEPSSDGSS